MFRRRIGATFLRQSFFFKLTSEKTMKKISAILSLLFSLALFLFESAFSQSKLNINMDICQYRFNQDSSLVEVYYSLLPEKPMETSSASYVLELRILQNNRALISNMWKVQEQSDAANKQAQPGMIIDVMRYLLAPGIYDVKVLAKNILQPDKMDSAQISNITVKNFSAENIELSDIEICQFISPANPANKQRFDKNNFHVLPNPMKIFTKENPDVYYYFESYNLRTHFEEPIFEIKRLVFDSNGLPIPEAPEFVKKKRLRGLDDVEVGMVNISNLPTGKYFLNFKILDAAASELASRTNSFYVHNPDIMPVDRNMLPIEKQVATSEIALLSHEDIDIMLNATMYLLDDNEKKLAQNLNNDEAKRLFLYQFWKEQDSTTETLVLESYRDFLKRVQYANANFASIKMAGWASDRGRVLIKYGQPSEIQYYPNVSDFKEFQAWSYDQIENGVVFIFCVLGSFGTLQLIHSTKTGEMHNEFWFDLLSVSEGETGMQRMEYSISNRSALQEIFRKNNLELPRYLK
jgi:GWxTD domain-containing protein